MKVHAEVVIQGKLINIKATGDLFYSKPINTVGNILYAPHKIPFINDTSFRIRTTLTHGGFIFLKLPGKSVTIFANPNDSIHFDILYVPDSINKKMAFSAINFFGNNAMGHNLLNSNASYLNLQNFLLNNLFLLKVENLDNFFKISQNELSKLCSPLDSLWQSKKIDRNFYNVVKLNIQGDYSYGLFGLFNYLSNSKNLKISKDLIVAKNLNITLFSNVNYDSLRIFFYRKINPLDTNFIFSFLGKDYYHIYCEDKFKGLIGNPGFYDSSFLKLSINTRYLGYMKGNLLEASWAEKLYVDAMSENRDDLIRSYRSFIKHFPNSNYLPFIKTRLNLSSTGFVQVGESNKFSFLKNVNVTSLKQTIVKNFMQEFVVVDLWATWCSPCIYQFTFKKAVENFLNQNNIGLLYISLNDSSQSDLWRKFVIKNRLFGKHMLSAEGLTKYISKNIYSDTEITIPRYLLINKMGEVLSSELPMPSDGENFEAKILSLIKRE